MGWLVVLLGLVALVTGLLAIPVQLRFSAAAALPEVPLRATARLRWLFGLVDLPLQKGKAPPARPRAPGRKPARRPASLRLRPLVMNPAFWQRLGRLLKRLFHAVHWHELRLRGRLGLDDPADTGYLWGMLVPAQVSFPSWPAGVELRPAFEGPALEFDASGAVRLVPLQLLWILLSFALAPATWRVLRPAWRR